MLLTLGSFLSGLGLFFYGLKLVTTGLRRSSGLKLRKFMTRSTRSRFSAYGVGYLSGVVFQAVPAVAFVLSSLIAVGALKFKRALPIQLGVNAGASLLVLIAIFDIKLAVLFLVGVACMAVAFERPRAFRNAATVVLGVGLIFMGLIMVREATAPLAQTEWCQAFLSKDYPLLGFLLAGLVLTFLLQTTVGVVLLAVTMAGTGVLEFNETLFVILGACLASSAITLVYSTSIKGTPKQMILAQACYNLLGVALFVLLIEAEDLLGVPTVPALLKALAPTVQGQTGIFFLVYDHAVSLILLLAAPLYARIMIRLSPELEVERWSRPTYLQDHLLLDPPAAALALNKEQGRLIGLESRYLEVLRRENGIDGGAAKDVSASFDNLASEIRRYLNECLQSRNDPQTADLLVQLDRCQEMLELLDGAVRDLCADLAHEGFAQEAPGLRDALLEGMDMLLTHAASTFDSGDLFDWRAMEGMTQDRSDILRNIRTRYLQEEIAMASDARLAMLRLFNSFDRMVWLLRQLFTAQRFVLQTNGVLAPEADVPGSTTEAGALA